MTSLETILDHTSVGRARAIALASGEVTTEKLELLGRLRRQYVDGSLPLYSESSIEQSWNEQLFARVFGYRSQFAHGGLTFEMKAKNRQGTYYSDFSLGFFGTLPDRVLVTAELKGPEADLLREQGSKYGHLTPVEQAFRTARSVPGCLWVLVSNFRELRLYSVADDQLPIMRADLTAIHSLNDLALLIALCSPRSLIGDRRHPPQLTAMLNTSADRASMPLPPAREHYRMVARFTPLTSTELPLFRAEQALREAILRASQAGRFISSPGYGEPLEVVSRFDAGWVAVDGAHRSRSTALRVALSLFGELLVSVQLPLPDNANRLLNVHELRGALAFVCELLQALKDPVGAAGLFGAELRDVAGASIHAESDLLRRGMPNYGVTKDETIIIGDFRADLNASDTAHLGALALCEFAAHFRSNHGGVGLDFDTVRTDMQKIWQTSTSGPAQQRNRPTR